MQKVQEVSTRGIFLTQNIYHWILDNLQNPRNFQKNVHRTLTYGAAIDPVKATSGIKIASIIVIGIKQPKI